MQNQVAQALLEIGAVGFSPEQPVTFKSGIVSPVYVDNRRLPFHPPAWRIIVEGFQSVLKQPDMTYDVIAGVAMGGIPHSAVVGYLLNKPSVFIRKESKAYGKMNLIEGGNVEGRHAVLIEDLVTTGGSSLAAVDRLREAGAEVGHVVAIVSYGFPQSTENFAQKGVTLHTLTDFDTILSFAERESYFDSTQATLIRDWFKDPFGWGERHNAP